MSQTPLPLTPRQRVNTAIAHVQPDRVPVDFLAVPEIWQALSSRMGLDAAPYQALAPWMEPWREAILAALQVDCRVMSNDMFVRCPEHVLKPGAKVDWWQSPNRSTPNRMWRQVSPDGLVADIWGVQARRSVNQFGAHESYSDFPLASAESVDDLRSFAWPQADWWDFSDVPLLLEAMDSACGQVHIRYRVGSVFEVAWQLCGMEKFLTDMMVAPEVPAYIMDRLCEVHVENTRRFLRRAAGRVDMIYFYDDVATTQSLLMPPAVWSELVRPRHQRIIDVAREMGVKVMYHCDGAVAPLIPRWVEMGIDVLNPIQTEAAGMDIEMLKMQYGKHLCFHGGLSIIEVLPKGTPRMVREEVKRLVSLLNRDGGYILASSHHIQADTPLENILAMYDLSLR